MFAQLSTEPTPSDIFVSHRVRYQELIVYHPFYHYVDPFDTISFAVDILFGLKFTLMYELVKSFRWSLDKWAKLG
jgi:hypothetical protein